MHQWIEVYFPSDESYEPRSCFRILDNLVGYHELAASIARILLFYWLFSPLWTFVTRHSWEVVLSIGWSEFHYIVHVLVGLYWYIINKFRIKLLWRFISLNQMNTRGRKEKWLPGLYESDLLIVEWLITEIPPVHNKVFLEVKTHILAFR